MNEFNDFLSSINTVDSKLKDFIKALSFEKHNMIYDGRNIAYTAVDGFTMSFFIKDDYAAFTIFDTYYRVLDRATFKLVNNEWRENDG